MSPATTSFALALDLVDDARSIEAYEAAHQSIWPEVRTHLVEHGVLSMQIYRLGTRLFMLMEVDNSLYCAERMAQAALDNPAVVEWEALMSTYQSPTPWSTTDVKWTVMDKIFSL